MQKKGVSTIFVLFSVGAAILILMASASISQRMGKGEAVKQAFLTKDSALMMDALHAVSGNVVFNYETFNFTEDLKMAMSRDSLQLVPNYGPSYSFPFRSGKLQINFPKEIFFEKQKISKFQFIKSGSKIYLGQDIKYTEEMSCPDVETKDDKWRQNKIIIDYIYSENQDETTINRLTALSLFNLLSSDNANTEPMCSLEANELIDIEDKIKKSSDSKLIISLSLAKTNQLNIYISGTPESRKLACLIHNNMAKFDFESISILPSDYPLLKNKFAVLLELGNYNKDSKNNVAKYSDAIYKSIRSYYG